MSRRPGACLGAHPPHPSRPFSLLETRPGSCRGSSGRSAGAALGRRSGGAPQVLPAVDGLPPLESGRPRSGAFWAEDAKPRLRHSHSRRNRASIWTATGPMLNRLVMGGRGRSRAVERGGWGITRHAGPFRAQCSGARSRQPRRPGSTSRSRCLPTRLRRAPGPSGPGRVDRSRSLEPHEQKESGHERMPRHPGVCVPDQSVWGARVRHTDGHAIDAIDRPHGIGRVGGCSGWPRRLADCWLSRRPGARWQRLRRPSSCPSW